MSKFRPDQSVAAIPSSYEGQKESANLTCIDPGGVYNVQTITSSIVSGATQGDYVIITDADGNTTAIWLDIDADGTEPNGAGYVATGEQIEVDVLSTDTAAQAGAKLAAAISGTLVGFTVTAGGATTTLTSTLKGDCAEPTASNEAENDTGSFTVAEATEGTDPTLQGQYVLVNNGSTTYSLWFSSNGNGSDPAVADTTAEEVALVGNETTAGVATALAASIDGLSGLHAEADGTRVIITGDSNLDLTNFGVGDSGFSLEYRAQGGATLLSPGSSVTSISSSPSSY